MDIKIIYQDNDIIAINKPAGVVIHRVNLKNQKSNLAYRQAGLKLEEKEMFLTDWLMVNFPEIKDIGDEPELRPGIVHRLDKDTSGVLIIAKNQKSFEFLKNQFQDRKIVKKYIILVEGNLKKEKGIIDLPIGRSKSDFRKKLASNSASGDLREAVTEYKVLEKFPNYSLVEAYPKTGRTHQIRVHFKAIGHPVVCDYLYGGKKAECPAELNRQFLHANFLELTAPSGTRLKLEADLPEDLEKTLDVLRKNK